MHSLNPQIEQRPLAIPFSLMGFSQPPRARREPQLQVNLVWSCSNRQPR